MALTIIHNPKRVPLVDHILLEVPLLQYDVALYGPLQCLVLDTAADYVDLIVSDSDC